MKKLIIILVIFLSVGESSAQKTSFQVQYSEPLAVFQFVIDISNKSGTNANKTGFLKSKFNTLFYQDLLTKFETINYFYWYDYKEYPYGNKIGGNTYFLLSKNIVESNSIQEFSSKSLGIIPNADLLELTKILSQFVPVFRALVYKPNESIIKEQMKLIEAKIKATNVSLFLNQVIRFHHSSWDISRPFILNVCPSLPGNGISAVAFANCSYIKLPVNQKDIALFLSFMFHESFHIIYDEQSLEFKKEFATWFKENSSKYSRYSELLFNEAITTALSSGYLYENLKDSPLPNDKWYVNPYIARMAVAIAPLTKKYIGESKQIDKAFIDAYIQLYESKYPEWLNDINNVMGERFIICEDSSSAKIISQTFPHRSIREFKDEISLYSIEEIKKHPITKMIVVSKNNMKTIELIKNNFTELKDWKPNSSSDFSYSVFLADRTYLIIINTVTGNLEEILKQINLN